jgi:NAD(P)-dependent dehydrogenase (short-subunit alcohol dehydrogenase family)
MTGALQFAGKAAFVTGAGSGIGRAAAQAMAKEGARVALVGHRPEGIAETARLIEEAGGEALAIECDVSGEREVQAAVRQAADAFGRLDFAFNNAGVEDRKARVADIPSEEWHRIIATDLSSVFYCMKHQLPWLARQGGVIVNTSSTAGVAGFPMQASYCAAKFGVIGLSKVAALDYARDGVRVNVIAPGLTRTKIYDRMTAGDEGRAAGFLERIPLGRPGRAEEIAGTFVWLCSDAGAYATGATFVIDGGLTV